MSIFKTTIKRGKKPLNVEDLKPQGIYAVRTLLSNELQEQWQVGEAEQWGLIVLDDKKNIIRSYHVFASCTWFEHDQQPCPVKVEDMQVFRSSAMEQCFCMERELGLMERGIITKRDEEIRLLRKELKMLEDKVAAKNRRFVQRIANFIMREC